MNTRLNVTEQERLRYSYRRLRAISRLRDAGIEPTYGMYKEHLVPASGRLGYRVELPDGSDCYFQRLVDIEAFAEEYRLWKRTQAQPFAIRVSFAPWQADPMQRMLALVTAGLWVEQQPTPTYKATHVPVTVADCSWPECKYPANGVIDGQALCAGHAMVYGQIRLAQQAQPVGATSNGNYSTGRGITDGGEEQHL